MATLFFDEDKRRIYEVPEASTFIVDGSGYRIYTPIDIPSAETNVVITTEYFWSRYVDFHDTSKWTTLVFEKSGGAFRGLDSEGAEEYAFFDIRLINEWLIVPANYPHDFTIKGNLFKELGLNQDFDTTRITVLGVSPRIRLSDSGSTTVVNGFEFTQEQLDAFADAVWNKQICP